MGAFYPIRWCGPVLFRSKVGLVVCPFPRHAFFDSDAGQPLPDDVASNAVRGCIYAVFIDRKPTPIFLPKQRLSICL